MIKLSPLQTSSITCAILVLILASWLSSGTMTPHAATMGPPCLQVVPPCSYLVSCDHPHHRAVFAMLDGAPRSSWGFSVLLRRVLYFVLSFPLMKALGFELGGFVANLLLTISAVLVFTLFVRNTIGEYGAQLAAWLLATYPGITYWVGLPYEYAFIVPGALALSMLLWNAANTTSARSIFLIALGIGFISWGYDFLPIFGLAFLLILVRTGQWRHLPQAVAGVILPIILLALLLHFRFNIPTRNSNTESYIAIASSFFKPIDYQRWRNILLQAPLVFIKTYFFSNFTYLPVLYLAYFSLNAKIKNFIQFKAPEPEILLSALALFMSTNLIPPYGGWQMRGEWIARLYQPVFVVFVLQAARSFQFYLQRPSSAAPGYLKPLAAILAVSTVLANATICFGPSLGLETATQAYYRFYRQGEPDQLSRNLEMYGRRPLGFCQPPGARR